MFAQESGRVIFPDSLCSCDPLIQHSEPHGGGAAGELESREEPVAGSMGSGVLASK